MRAKQSSTALGMHSRSGPFIAPIPIRAPAAVPVAVAIRGVTPIHSTKPGTAVWSGPAVVCAGVAQGEGLLHDARNLTGALGLYCDLLSVPGVLKPEHTHYAAELRLLGTRSGALMERLTLTLLASESGSGVAAMRTARPVSLREIVERCSGLLSRVAGGRAIEVSYGPAASAPVMAREEDFERVLVNLVRNAAAALETRGKAAGSPAKDAAARSTVREMVRDPAADPAPEAVRIGVGQIQERIGDARPWPFGWVRLTVEDSGCGMGAEQVKRLLEGSGALARGGRGVGFRVVRELVAAAGGDLRVMSAAGLGTQVQIEWPVATVALEEMAEIEGKRESRRALGLTAAGAGPRRSATGDRRGAQC